MNKSPIAGALIALLSYEGVHTRAALPHIKQEPYDPTGLQFGLRVAAMGNGNNNNASAHGGSSSGNNNSTGV